MIRSDHVVKIGSRNQGCLYTRVTSRRPVLLGEFPAQMTQRPLYTKSCVHRQVDTNTHTHTHKHTHTHTHTQEPGLYFKACRILSAKAEILAGTYSGDTFST
jgi:hypothetical protein